VKRIRHAARIRQCNFECRVAGVRQCNFCVLFAFNIYIMWNFLSPYGFGTPEAEYSFINNTRKWFCFQAVAYWRQTKILLLSQGLDIQILVGNQVRFWINKDWFLFFVHIIMYSRSDEYKCFSDFSNLRLSLYTQYAHEKKRNKSFRFICFRHFCY